MNSNMVLRRSGANLDSLDLKIIAELEINPRQSYANLAALFDVNETTINRRVNRLLRERVISFAVVLNTAAAGYHWAQLGLNVSQGYAQSVASEIARHPLINVSIVSGQYDIMAWITYKNEIALFDVISGDLGKIRNVTRIEAFPVLKVMKYVWNLLGETNHEPLPSGMIRRLEESDWNLLAELEKNPRITSTHLAKKLGISRQTVSAKLRRLHDEDVFRIQCVVSHSALGYLIHLGTLIKVRPGSILDVAEQLTANRSVEHLIAISGQYDLAMRTAFRDMDEMSSFLMNEMGKIPGIVSSDNVLHLKALSSQLPPVRKLIVHFHGNDPL